MSRRARQPPTARLPLAGGLLAAAWLLQSGLPAVAAELDASCNVVMPFDGINKGVAGGVYNSGTPEQRAAAQDLARRAALDPRLSIQPAILDPPAPPPPAPPYEERTLVITYPFDSDRASGPDMVKPKALAVYARAAAARRVRVTGHRGDSRLSDGSDLAEKPPLAEARAKKVAGILQALGIDAAVTQVQWELEAPVGRGDEDWRNRRVEVTVSP